MSSIVKVHDAILKLFIEAGHHKGKDRAKKVKKYVRSLVDAVCKLTPFPDLDKLSEFIVDMLGELEVDACNRKFEEWLSTFKDKLHAKYPSAVPSPRLVPLILSICDGKKNNKNHQYRAKSISNVLWEIELITEKNEKLPLAKLLPPPERFAVSNKEWKNDLVAFRIQMYYFKRTNRVVPINRCCVIRNIYKDWEHEAGGESTLNDAVDDTAPPSDSDRINLPSLSLSLKALSVIMPRPEVVLANDDATFTNGIKYWKFSMANFVIAGLRQFPIQSLDSYIEMCEFQGDDYDSISTSSGSQDESIGYSDCEKAYRHNPYGEVSSRISIH